MKVTINNTTKKVTIELDMLTELRASSTGATESIAEVRNQETGLKHTDGRPIKVTAQVYVKPPKVA